jgi:hypothetical protein
MCQNHILRVEITLLCDFYTPTVMNTRRSVFSECKMWFQHARAWFIYVLSYFYTQSVIHTRRVWFIHVGCNFHTLCDVKTQMLLRLWFKHAQEWFLHAECDVDTYKCDYDTYECGFDTHESDYDTHTYQNHTLRVWITLVCDVHTHTVMKCNFWMQSVECDFYTQCNLHTQSVISTRRV